MEAFVYCWTDHKTNRLYVGSHKGTIDDGYVCSSKHMMKEYKNRPADFTRQIIAEGKLEDIRILEGKILKASNARLDEQFYNKHDNDGLFFEGWKKGQFSEEHRRNMSIAASKRVKRGIDPIHLQNLNEGRRKSKNSPKHLEAIRKARKGVPMSKEAIEKARISRLENNDTKKLASHAGKISMKKYKNDPDRQQKHSERMKLWWAERKAKDNN